MCCCVCSVVSASGQDLLSNKRVKVFRITADTLKIDSLSLVPGSLVLKNPFGNVIASSNYLVLYEKALLVFNAAFLSDSGSRMQSITAKYRVFPLLFSKNYFHKSNRVFLPDESGKINPFLYTGVDQKNLGFWGNDGLSKNGSIARGIAFGNNQDVVLNSNLNLQLSGRLTDKISLLAAISDDNIPIQAEGNTQQLQEFDRVYVQFNDDKSKLIAGDFQLLRPNSYFMNYFKKAQGASFSSTFPAQETGVFKEGEISVSLSAAVSKGKFSRNVIVGLEGNQGPYRLKGAENESFIIVLSGSEKIYIDGQLIERGQDKDYVIDYNTAEVTFTANKLITKDKRITAEFQYSDKNYARSLFAFGNTYKNKRFNIRLNLYSEQDNKKKPLLQELKSNEKTILSQIGDSLLNAVVPSIDTSGYLPNTILYASIDSLGFSNVFVYSTDSAKAKYRLTFSNVGAGNGDYVPVNTSANGRVYQWVAPLNGIKQGSYAPVVLLISPKKKQMLSLGADCIISKNLSAGIELGYSSFDKNTFSGFDKKDNDGLSLLFKIQNKNALKKQTNDTLFFTSSASIEMVSKYFSPIERFRAVEFDREWNRTTGAIVDNQSIVGAKLGLEKKSLGFLNYQFSSFTEKLSYKGNQQAVSADLHKNKFRILANASYLSSISNSVNSAYLKYKSVASREIKSITVGAGVEQEESKFNNLSKDSLYNNSFRFLEWRAFVKSADTSKNNFSLNYINRTDWLSNAQSFEKVSLGQSLAAYLTLAKNEKSVLKITGTYRKLSLTESSLLSRQPDNSVVTRVEYDLSLLRGVIKSSTFYEVGSGLEIKKEFTFLRVQPGQGLYQWIDANNDSIQDIDEFVVAVFQDKAEYLKVFNPTNEFVKTFNNQFNEILTLSPALAWGNKKGFKKLVGLFSNQTAYRIDKKTNNNDASVFLNPFLNQAADPQIVTLNSSIRNTFFFNRYNSVYGADYSYQKNQNKSLLVNGAEFRTNDFHLLKIRWNLSRKWLLSNESESGVKSNVSEFFKSRNFKVVYLKTEPKITFQPSVAFRVALSYMYSEKNNRVSGEDSLAAKSQKIGIEAKYNQAQKGMLSLKFAGVFIQYNGIENSYLGYEMLEGLLPGKNFTWNLGYQRTLANNIQLNISYDGRKSGSGKVIHIGSLQVRAYF